MPFTSSSSHPCGQIEANSFVSCKSAISSLAGRVVALLSVSRAYLNQVELSGRLHCLYLWFDHGYSWFSPGWRMAGLIMCSFGVTYTWALSPLSPYDLIRSCKLQKGGAWLVCLDGMLPAETQDAKGNGADDSVNATLPSESAMKQKIRPLQKGTKIVLCCQDGVENLKFWQLVLLKIFGKNNDVCPYILTMFQELLSGQLNSSWQFELLAINLPSLPVLNCYCWVSLCC